MPNRHFADVKTEIGFLSILIGNGSNSDYGSQLMKKAIGAVKSIEITRAVRSAQLDGLSIKKKQAIGFLDRALVAVGDSTVDVLNKTLARINMDESEVITIYYGAETEPASAEQVGADLLERFPQLQIEVVRGDQPHYEYIISVE